jgi:hypothetical protein
MYGMVIVDIDGQVAADDLVVLHTVYTGWWRKVASAPETSMPAYSTTADKLLSCCSIC